MFNTTATAKIVYNKNLNTHRLLVAFNTTKVTVQNAAYISGDLQCFNSRHNFATALQSAMQSLRITAIQHLQITKQSIANMQNCDVSDLCYTVYDL